MSAPIASTATGDVNGGAMDASGPARVHPTTADGELNRNRTENPSRFQARAATMPVTRLGTPRRAEDALIRAIRGDEGARDAEGRARGTPRADVGVRAPPRLCPRVADGPRPPDGHRSRGFRTRRDVPPDPRAGVSPVPEDSDERRPSERRRRRSSRRARAYIAAAYSRQRETTTTTTTRRGRKIARRRGSVGGDGDAKAAPEDVAPRVSALDVIGRCAAEVRGIFADRARGSRGDSDSPDALTSIFSKKIRRLRPRDRRGCRPHGHVETNDDTDEEWAAAMECACRLGPHYHLPGDASSDVGCRVGPIASCSSTRVAGSAARIAGKLALPTSSMSDSDVVDALVALTATEGRAAWVRHDAASPWAARAPRGIGGDRRDDDDLARFDGDTALDGTPTAPSTEPVANATSNAGEHPPRSPDDDDAFVDAAARVDSLVVDSARDRVPDLHVPSGGDVSHHHGPHHQQQRRTPHDALAAALTDPCGFVRVAATHSCARDRVKPIASARCIFCCRT